MVMDFSSDNALDMTRDKWPGAESLVIGPVFTRKNAFEHGLLAVRGINRVARLQLGASRSRDVLRPLVQKI